MGPCTYINVCRPTFLVALASRVCAQMAACVEWVCLPHPLRMIHVGKDYQAEVEDYCTGE